MVFSNEKCSLRIIILNYNTPVHTLNLIRSLEKQVFGSCEIIVVDNGSTLTNIIFLSEHLPPTIKLIKSAKNVGYSAGNNLGLKHYSDPSLSIDYHLILNSDIIIHDIHFLQKMVHAFSLSEHQNVYAQSPLINTFSSKYSLENQIQVRRLMTPLKMMVVSFTLGKRLFRNWYQTFIYAAEMPFANKYLRVDTINGAAWMVKDSFLRSVNYLDENVFLYHEEMIVGKKVQNSGGSCLLNGFVQVGHLQGLSTKSNNMSFSLNMEKYKILSEAYFLEKYCNVSIIAIKLFLFLKHIELILKRIFILYK